MNVIGQPFSRHARERARRTALQALYEVAMTGKTPAEILNAYANSEYLKKADRNYFRILVEGVISQQASLDTHMKPHLDRAIQELDPVEHVALSIGLYELLYQPDIPSRAVINEAVELVKMFGAEESYRYINSILDKAARQLRPDEFHPGRSQSRGTNKPEC